MNRAGQVYQTEREKVDDRGKDHNQKDAKNEAGECTYPNKHPVHHFYGKAEERKEGLMGLAQEFQHECRGPVDQRKMDY